VATPAVQVVWQAEYAKGPAITTGAVRGYEKEEGMPHCKSRVEIDVEFDDF
jgi:hypothetical protein